MKGLQHWVEQTLVGYYGGLGNDKPWLGLGDQAMKYRETNTQVRALVETLAKVMENDDEMGNLMKMCFGTTSEEKALVSQWMSFQAKELSRKDLPEITNEHTIGVVDDALVSSSFLASSVQMTLADLVVYYSIHPIVVKMGPSRIVDEFPCVARWLDQIQNSPILRKSGASLPRIKLDVPDFFSSATFGTTTTQVKGKGKGKGKGKVEANNAGEGKNKKKDKGDKTKENKSQEQVAKKGEEKIASQDDDQPEISKLEFRVGQIVKIWKHPEKDKLYCEEIDLGEDKPRTIASGLVDFYPDQSVLLHRKVVVVTNLKPRKMGEFASNGMVLCASSEGKEKVEVVDPPKEAEIGEKITFPDIEGNFQPFNPSKVAKSKVFEKTAPNLKTNDKKQPYWLDPTTNKQHIFTTSKGPCTVPTIANGTVS